MKKMVLIFLVLLTSIVSPVLSSPIFPDEREAHWARDAVDDLAARGILEGYPDGTFRGDRSATRWQMTLAIQRTIAKMELVHSNFATKAEMETSKSSINQLKNKIDSLGNRVKNLEENINTLNKRISDLEKIALKTESLSKLKVEDTKKTRCIVKNLPCEIKNLELLIFNSLCNNGILNFLSYKTVKNSISRPKVKLQKDRGNEHLPTETLFPRTSSFKAGVTYSVIARSASDEAILTFYSNLKRLLLLRYTQGRNDTFLALFFSESCKRKNKEAITPKLYDIYKDLLCFNNHRPVPGIRAIFKGSNKFKILETAYVRRYFNISKNLTTNYNSHPEIFIPNIGRILNNSGFIMPNSKMYLKNLMKSNHILTAYQITKNRANLSVFPIISANPLLFRWKSYYLKSGTAFT